MSKPNRPLRALLSRSAAFPLSALAPIVLSVLVACSDGASGTNPAKPDASGTRDAQAEAQTERQGEATPEDPTGATRAGDAVRTSTKEEPKLAPRHPGERPFPAFSGMSLDGSPIDAKGFLGARAVFFFFNPEVAGAADVARAVGRIHAISSDHNFKVAGVGIGSETAKLAAFVEQQQIEFPVIDDSNGAITTKLQLRAPMGILGVDPEGYMTFAMGHFPAGSELAAQVEQDLGEHLRLAPPTKGAHDGELLRHPAAPQLSVVALSSGQVLETKDLAGKAAIVIFFLHTCPHCHKALESIRATLDQLSEAEKPRLVAISVQNDASAVRSALKELKLDFFDPYLDPGGKAADRWGVTGGVPVVHVVDGQGRIRHRTEGWNGTRDAGIVRMQIAKAAGAKVPMLLDPKGYSGNDVCGVCHEQEAATWRFTAHSSAYSTLITHGADRRADCVGCHVVGFEQAGGWNFDQRPPHLENVGCESCHGRGGPHLTPGFVPAEGYAAVCSTCHNPTHSLGFDYAQFAPRISHAAIAALSNEARAALRSDGGPERDLLPTAAAYVGSNACQSCHAKEFETWSKGPHAHALATLEKAGKASNADCLGCHTTGYAKTGGFAPGTAPAAAPDLARVGCESCHGPGANHVGESAAKVGTILSLGDKCDSCVILKVCGTCHDKANDPGFEFEVEKRIEAQRHGTIPSAATRGSRSAALAPPDAAGFVPLVGPAEPS